MIRRIEQYNIVVGPFDEYEAELDENSPHRYDVLVNLCDRPPYFDRGRFRLYWYPINEMSDWGYGPFFWSKRILDFYTTRNDRILVHCAAGVHRSPMVVFAWLLSIEVGKNGPGDANLDRVRAYMDDDSADITWRT